MFGAGQATGRQLGDDLRGVGHARVGEVHVSESIRADDPQPVVRVGEGHAGAQTGNEGSEA